MARRPVFLPSVDGRPAVRVALVDFDWHPGLSRSQKLKCVEALHAAARRELGVSNPLEISSVSPAALGRKLSAFALAVEAPDGGPSTVEAVFQGCKVFADGGPFPELFRMSGRDARRDPRVGQEATGDRRRPTGFRHGDQDWPADGRTTFYDWLYIEGLLANRDLAEALDRFDAFTDIAFNPERSLNCQARAAAVYLALLRRLEGNRAKLEAAMRDVGTFRRLHGEITGGPREAGSSPAQGELPLTGPVPSAGVERPAPRSETRARRRRAQRPITA